MSDGLLGSQGCVNEQNHGTWPTYHTRIMVCQTPYELLIGITEFNLHLSVKIRDPEIKWLAQGYTASNWHDKDHTFKLFIGSYSAAAWFEVGKILASFYM